jgi:protein-S-isoprenylcysteine O-methyltransferase Ste14
VGSRFIARGGLWVAGQGPLMVGTIAVACWLGRLAQGPLLVAAAVVLAAGMALGIWSRIALGSAFTPFPRPVEDGRQAMGGPYRLVRHPMYLAIIVATCGWSLLWQSWAGAIGATILLVFFDLKARHEERWLEQTYPSYAEYRRRVRRFIPLIY